MDHFIEKHLEWPGNNSLPDVAQQRKKNNHDQYSQPRDFPSDQNSKFLLDKIIRKIKYKVDHINGNTDRG